MRTDHDVADGRLDIERRDALVVEDVDERAGAKQHLDAVNVEVGGGYVQRGLARVRSVIHKLGLDRKNVLHHFEMRLGGVQRNSVQYRAAKGIPLIHVVA